MKKIYLPIITVANYLSASMTQDEYLTLNIYGPVIGNLLVMTNKKLNSLFKNSSSLKYMLYPFCKQDLRYVNIDENNSENNADFVRSAMFYLSSYISKIPPCSNNMEYITFKVIEKMWKTDKKIKEYINTHFKNVKIEQRNTKPNEPTDYLITFEYKTGEIYTITGEHKAVSFTLNGRAAAGTKIEDFIQAVKDRKPDMINKVLFKVETVEENGNYIMKSFFVGNFLTRIAINHNGFTLNKSGAGATIPSDYVIAPFVWRFNCHSIDDICETIILADINRKTKNKQYFIRDENNKEFMLYSDDKNQYGFVEILRKPNNTPYISVNGKETILSNYGKKFQQYKKWTNISLDKISVNKIKYNKKHYHTRNKYRIKYLETIKSQLLEQNQNIDISKLAGVQRVIVNGTPKIIMVSKKGNIEVGKKIWKDQYYSKHPDIAIIDNYKISA